MAAYRVEMFSALDEIAARLEGIYARVFTGLDAAALRDWPRTPAAFVLPLTEAVRAEPGGSAPVLHPVSMVVGVHTLLAAPNDPGHRSATRESLAGTLDAARRQLAGFSPQGAAAPLAFQRGTLVDLDGGRLEWRDEYRLDWWLRAPAPTSNARIDPSMPARLHNQQTPKGDGR